jgi:hypothetical protein
MELEFFVRRIQVAIFGDIDLANKIEVAAGLSKTAENLFDGEPTILPIPIDAPPEIPRVILASKDSTRSCNVMPTRLDFFFTQKERPGKKLSEVKEDYLGWLSDIAEVTKAKLKVKVERLGIITELAIFPEQEPIRFMREMFLREEPFGGSREIHLNILDRFMWDTMEVNRWYRFRCFSSGIAEEPDALHVLIDINTLPEVIHDFGAEGISSFCSQVFTFIESDLRSLLEKGGWTL